MLFGTYERGGAAARRQFLSFPFREGGIVAFLAAPIYTPALFSIFRTTLRKGTDAYGTKTGPALLADF